jgi:hypothetical protein
MNEEIYEQLKKLKSLDLCFNFGSGLMAETIINVKLIHYSDTGVYAYEITSGRPAFVPFTAIKWIGQHSDVVDLGLKDQERKNKEMVDNMQKIIKKVV